MRLLSVIFLSIPLAAQVRFDVKSDRVAIRIGGKPFSVLHFGKEANKPFLHPLLTASGKAVTRGFPVEPLPGDSTDRPHQRGLWIGAEHVSGGGFLGERSQLSGCRTKARSRSRSSPAWLTAPIADASFVANWVSSGETAAGVWSGAG